LRRPAAVPKGVHGVFPTPPTPYFYCMMANLDRHKLDQSHWICRGSSPNSLPK
jgi:hypothetical protein